jgi:multiple sugar transport system ATP-binding protein
MDEPLSNLDAKLRVQMRTEITKLHQRLQTTFIYVTHDQTEAMTFGTRIVVMKDGVIQQVDSPVNLYNKPNNLFVAGFIGSPQMNLLEAAAKKSGDDVFLTVGAYDIKLTESKAKLVEDGGYIGKTVIMGIRPEDLHDEESVISTSPAGSLIDADVEVTELLGAEVFLYLSVAGQSVTARVNPRSTAKTNDRIKMAVDLNKVHIFDKDTEKAITN